MLSDASAYTKRRIKNNCTVSFCRGADIDCFDKDNYTPLLVAASEGHTGVVKLLLEKGANLKATDMRDKTAIFLAAEENRVDTLKVCLFSPHACLSAVLGDSRKYPWPYHGQHLEKFQGRRGGSWTRILKPWRGIQKHGRVSALNFQRGGQQKLCLKSLI